jgi:hypothetical protein
MTFGIYKGKQLYLLHIAKDEYGNVQSPLFAPLRKESTWYSDLLARKVNSGYVSQSLEIYSRDGTDVGKQFITILNTFKQKVRSK